MTDYPQTNQLATLAATIMNGRKGKLSVAQALAEAWELWMEVESVRKGYLLDDFSDSFARYLPPRGDSNRYAATEPVNTGENPALATATDGLCNGLQNAQNPNKDGAGSGVADEKPGETEEIGKAAEPERRSDAE